jgi:sec-independent protein translocase protein TatB
MIEISFGKLILLAVIALIVLGPEKLPGAARTAGALLRRVRTGWDSVRAEVERELQVEEIRRQAREAAERATAAQAELDATLRKMQPIGNAVVSPAPATSEAPPESAVPVLDSAPPKEAPHGGV